MGTILKIKDNLLRGNELMKFVWRFGRGMYHFFCYTIMPDKYVVKKLFKGVHGHLPNLRNPQTLNEKLTWMKLYDRERWHSFYADKYVNRDYIAGTFGEQYLVPLLFTTKDPKDVRPENISEFPCVVKSNHAQAQWKIVRKPEDVDWKSLRRECKWWLRDNWYNYSKEYQYKYIERRIIVEKMLQTKDGKIPNDYKLHFINGKLEFIYVSYDREGGNYRVIYDPNWNKLPFVWIENYKYYEGINDVDVPRPTTLDDMIRIGTEVAKKFPRYVRVDFYDCDGHLYFGEITFHHGGALDSFFPDEYDLEYGKKLTL